jgi:hypothetical protein
MAPACTEVGGAGGAGVVIAVKAQAEGAIRKIDLMLPFIAGAGVDGVFNIYTTGRAIAFRG